MEVFLGLTIVALVMLLVYITSTMKQRYEKAIKELLEKSNAEGKEKFTEYESTIEVQKNVIMAQKSELNSLIVGINRLKDKLALTESSKKSSEVRLGQIGENFMPFINAYPYNHKNFHFLANPCDGLQIEEDAIIFVEFKTGGAKLSKSQKHIKDLVGQGKVRFETFRVDNKGATLKLESNMGNLLTEDKL